MKRGFKIISQIFIKDIKAAAETQSPKKKPLPKEV